MSTNSSTPEGVLVRLKEKICIALGIDVSKLKILIDQFVTTHITRDTTSKSHFAKVNYYNEISKDKMTIKVLFKFLRIIKIKRLKITFTLVTVRDREITVSEDINLFTGIEDDET